MGQQFRLAKKFQTTKVTVIIDALAVENLMPFQLMLEFKLIVALVTHVEATILPMQMIVQKDPKNNDKLELYKGLKSWG